LPHVGTWNAILTQVLQMLKIHPSEG